MNKRLKLIIIGLLFLLVVLLGLLYLRYNDKQIFNIQGDNVIAKINNHYNKYVKTNKECDLYDESELVVGHINKDVELVLKEIDIDENTRYFQVELEDGYYIKYEDVDPINELSLKDNRYKKYIPYNINIKTKDITTFYDKDNNLRYSLNNSYDFAVIIKDDKRYGIEFNNELMYIKDDDVANIYDSNNTELHNTNGVAVLNYHFFYDEDDEESRNSCHESICASKKQFTSHLDYFKENDILTVKMDELEMYMDEKIQLPKSVLITIDDGGRNDVGLELLTEYQMYATVFLITSWYNPLEYYKSEFIELHSHSHDLHNGGECSGGQGAEIKCLPKEEILDDLKQSREVLGGSRAFCYPFYEYNDYSEGLVKEAGFTMAFIGEVYRANYGRYKLAEPGGNKMRIPRFVVVDYTTMNDFNEYFNEIK